MIDFKILRISYPNYRKLVSVVCHCNHMTDSPNFDLDDLLDELLELKSRE